MGETSLVIFPFCGAGVSCLEVHAAGGDVLGELRRLPRVQWGGLLEGLRPLLEVLPAAVRVVGVLLGKELAKLLLLVERPPEGQTDGAEVCFASRPDLPTGGWVQRSVALQGGHRWTQPAVGSRVSRGRRVLVDMAFQPLT